MRAPCFMYFLPHSLLFRRLLSGRMFQLVVFFSVMPLSARAPPPPWLAFSILSRDRRPPAFFHRLTIKVVEPFAKAIFFACLGAYRGHTRLLLAWNHYFFERRLPFCHLRFLLPQHPLLLHRRGPFRRDRCGSFLMTILAKSPWLDLVGSFEQRTPHRIDPLLLSSPPVGLSS